MFAEFLQRDEFYEKYMQLLNVRLAISNLELENDEEMISPTRTIEIHNNLVAFKSIIEENPEKISPCDVINIAFNINRNINFFDRGFRKTQVEVSRAKNFFPINARYIPQAMYSLFDSYHNIWNILPVYERESRLHIELVRMQPFEDGNKRTARIVTNYNLCKENKAPVVISGKETDQYFSYIDDYDIQGFSQFLEKKSKEEFENMLNLYNTIIGDRISDNELTCELGENDVRLYEIMRKKFDSKEQDNIAKEHTKKYWKPTD